MDRDSQFFTVMHNRICEQTDLMGFFYPTSYGMPGCPVFYRSARITNRPADRPAKPILVENSANSSATRTARHGRNPHSSGIYTFFSFEEGSNIVQNIRHNRTSFIFWRESFFLPPPPTPTDPAPIPTDGGIVGKNSDYSDSILYNSRFR